jgi:hypothetical protein
VRVQAGRTSSPLLRHPPRRALPPHSRPARHPSRYRACWALAKKGALRFPGPDGGAPGRAPCARPSESRATPYLAVCMCTRNEARPPGGRPAATLFCWEPQGGPAAALSSQSLERDSDGLTRQGTPSHISWPGQVTFCPPSLFSCSLSYATTIRVGYQRLGWAVPGGHIDQWLLAGPATLTGMLHIAWADSEL